jgi:uncharacterized phage-associated protein
MSYIGSNRQAAETGLVPLDPRRICNLMLDETAHRRPLTNLALQKLLYFAHGLFLVESGQPLVSGYFEAWKFGPVHPAAYMAFKAAGDLPIQFRAVKRDPLTAETFPLPNPPEGPASECVRRVIASYARMTAGRLVELSHAPGAPWSFVVDKARTSMAFGMRIPDNVIRERFKYHKVSVGLQPRNGEPGEDAPFVK